ncbi:MAG: hypothetical protein ACREUZ_11195, partial [Burkholderiales bacterium]
MRMTSRPAVVMAVFVLTAGLSEAQTPPPAQTAVPTDVYHVMFVKAAPGQAAALGKELQQADPKDPMGAHVL